MNPNYFIPLKCADGTVDLYSLLASKMTLPEGTVPFTTAQVQTYIQYMFTPFETVNSLSIQEKMDLIDVISKHKPVVYKPLPTIGRSRPHLYA